MRRQQAVAPSPTAALSCFAAALSGFAAAQKRSQPPAQCCGVSAPRRESHVQPCAPGTSGCPNAAAPGAALRRANAGARSATARRMAAEEEAGVRAVLDEIASIYTSVSSRGGACRDVSRHQGAASDGMCRRMMSACSVETCGSGRERRSVFWPRRVSCKVRRAEAAQAEAGQHDAHAGRRHGARGSLRRQARAHLRWRHASKSARLHTICSVKQTHRGVESAGGERNADDVECK